MLASGNGEPARCTVNLLRTIRGEVPYVRTKGIAREIIDAPATESWRLSADAEWVIDSFEPRVDLDGVDVGAVASAARSGDMSAVAAIEERGGSHGR